MTRLFGPFRGEILIILQRFSMVTRNNVSSTGASRWAVRIVLLCGLGLLSTVAWSEIYRWVDEEGRVHFSDRVPPPVSRLERHVLDERGNLREVLHRQRTVEELEAHRARLAAMATEAQRREQQEQYDRYLLTSFKNLEDIESLRRERMEVRDNQISNLEKERESLVLALKKESERRTSSVVAQQNLLRNLEADLQRAEASLTELRAQRRKEFDGLSQDMQRYEFLSLRRSMFGER